MINSQLIFYILVCFSALQIPIIGGVNIGSISINSLKDLIVFGIVLFFLFKILDFKFPVNMFFSSIFFVFSLTLIYSLVISPSVMSGFQYFLKIMIPFFSFYLFKNVDFRSVDLGKLSIVVLKVYVGFVFLSLLFGGEVDGVFGGITDRHFFKFNAAFLFVLSFALIVKGDSKFWPVLGLLISTISIVAVMQRGAFISIFIACCTILYLYRFLRGWKLFISIIIILGSLTTLFTNEKFVEYSFYDGMGPSYIISEIIQGRFDTEFIRDRERGVLIEAIVDEHEFGFFPSGLGTAKGIINSDYTFFEGKEPHNDLLVLAVDMGFIGFFSVFFMLAYFVYRVKFFYNNSQFLIGEYAYMYFAVGAGLTFGYIVWMGFSNVIIYSSSSLVLPFVFIGVAEGIIKYYGGQNV
jgi:hypothetical protein